MPIHTKITWAPWSIEKNNVHLKIIDEEFIISMLNRFLLNTPVLRFHEPFNYSYSLLTESVSKNLSPILLRFL